MENTLNRCQERFSAETRLIASLRNVCIRNDGECRDAINRVSTELCGIRNYGDCRDAINRVSTELCVSGIMAIVETRLIASLRNGRIRNDGECRDAINRVSTEWSYQI